MNIGHLYGFSSYPPQHGGSIHSYNLIKNFTDLGCTVHAFDYEKNPQCEIYPVDEQGIQKFLTAIDVLYIRIDGGPLNRSDLKLRCMNQFAGKPIVWEINSTAEEMLAKFRFKLSNDAPKPQKAIDKVRQEFNNSYQQLRMELKVKREEHCRRKYAKLVSAATSVSSALKEYATSGLGIGKCEVIPNGSDPNFFTPKKKSDRLFPEHSGHFKIIYAGDSRWPWQGFDLLIELINTAKRRGDKILFIVLNNGPVEDIKTADNVIVFNSVNYADVPTYMASADACLCLYHDFPWSKYGFHLSSLKVFDYMASGKTVIASQLGQLATVIEDGKDGLLTNNHVDDIYMKILSCLNNKEKTVQLGAAAREKVINYYNWERAAKSTLDVIQAVSRPENAVVR